METLGLDCAGVKPGALDEPNEPRPWSEMPLPIPAKSVEKIEKWLQRLAVPIRPNIIRDGAIMSASYAGALYLVPLSHYQNSENYYFVLFHELAHWEGTKDGQVVITQLVGNSVWEELIADLTAIKLSGYFKLKAWDKCLICERLGRYQISAKMPEKYQRMAVKMADERFKGLLERAGA